MTRTQYALETVNREYEKDHAHFEKGQKRVPELPTPPKTNKNSKISSHKQAIMA